SNDPTTGAQNRLNSSHIQVFMGKDKKKGTVARVEAAGGVRFSGQRRIPKSKGTQLINGSGSKGVYFKEEGRLVLNGPVEYYAEQPTTDGKGKQWVRGTANEATYD